MLAKKEQYLWLKDLAFVEEVVRSFCKALTKISLSRARVTFEGEARETVRFLFRFKKEAALLICLPKSLLPGAALELGRRIIKFAKNLGKDWSLDIVDGNIPESLSSCLAWEENSLVAFYNSHIAFRDFLNTFNAFQPRTSPKISLSLTLGFVEAIDLSFEKRSIDLFPSGLCIGGFKMNFKISNFVVEANMNKEATNIPFPVKLDLGALEITLEELSGLREGVKLEFVLPKEVEATLRIGESPVAHGMVKVSGDGLHLEVSELLWEEPNAATRALELAENI